MKSTRLHVMGAVGLWLGALVAHSIGIERSIVEIFVLGAVLETRAGFVLARAELRSRSVGATIAKDRDA